MENATTTTDSADELVKFRSLIGQQPRLEGAPAAPAPDDPNAAVAQFRAQILPQSQSAVNRVADVSVASALTQSEREGRRDASGEIIPISNEGIGSKYWRAALQRGPEAQLAVLQKMYPDKRARVLEDGKVTIELTDSATGKPKEVIINPHGVDPADLMDLAAQTPEIAASIATSMAFSGVGFAKTAGQIVLSALAGAGTGAMRDVVSRSAEGIPIEFGEIGRTRGSEAALDMFLSTGLLGVAKSMKAISPFAKDIKAGTLEFDFQQGQKFFKDTFGGGDRGATL